MNKNLVGKWYSAELNETLNVFDEEPVRLKQSFPDSGYYGCLPYCVYEKDGYLCYEINDKAHRMVYHIKPENGELAGFYTFRGEEKPLRYTRVSETPEDEPFKFVPTEVYAERPAMKRIDILKTYSAYDRTKAEEPYTTKYVLCEEAPEILSKYGYESYISGKCGDELVFALLDFVCDHFQHCGSSSAGDKNVAGIIEFCKLNGSKVNCRGLAILLATLLRMNGIKARHITCMPFEDPFDDCHVVVDCLLPSGKRIMLDPTFRLYLTDKDGEYVSLPRLREMLVNGEEIFPCEKASYNGGEFDPVYQRQYMTKNTLRFSCGTFYKNGADDGDERNIELIPALYPTVNFPEGKKAEFVYNDSEFWKM